MSTHPYRKYFESPATRGIRSIRAGHEAVLGLALIYAAIGASLGILSGTAVAMYFPISGPAARTDLAQSSASVAGMSRPLMAAVSQIPMAQSQPALPIAQMPDQSHAATSVKSDAGKKSHLSLLATSAHKRSIISVLKSNGDLSAKGQPTVVADAASTAKSALSIEIATAQGAAPAFMIEGDATVADYDATTGLVETHEGKSFSIGSSAGVNSSWDDYSGHVHYRCDKGGNCTLSRAGVVVPNARMTT